METQVQNLALKKHRVVVIGGNFAGNSAARQLAALNQGDLELYLIDPSDTFNWTPNIHEILSGVKGQQSVEICRHELFSGLGLTFVQDKVVKLDPQDRTLRLGSGVELNFDACLIACGYHSVSSEISAHGEGAPVGFQFRSAADVLAIAEAIDAQRAEKEQLNISIVGGGFSGIEALGELLRRFRRDTDINISVIESSDRLVRNLPEAISDDIQKLTESCPVHFQFGCRVTGAADGLLSLSDGSVHQSDITIWTTGGALPSFVQDAGLVLSAENGIDVASSLQSAASPSCFVAGDVAAFSCPSSLTLSLPKQSYHALDMGHTAAKNLVNWLRGEELQPFEPTDKPTLLSFGDLNTYMISGNSVIASPLLAASKEAVYQMNMLKLSSPLPFITRKYGVVSRLFNSARRMLLPELLQPRPLQIMCRSRVLKYGSSADVVPLLQGARSTLFDSV